MTGPHITQARAELENASLDYYLTASRPGADPEAITAAVDRLEAAGNALAQARAEAEREAEADA